MLWLLAVEVLPNLHLAFHDDDHTHATGGMVVRVSFEAPHHHDDGVEHDHEHHAEQRPDHGPRELAIDEGDDPAHEAAGLAHRDVALQRPAPPLVVPTHIDRLVWHLASPVLARPDSIAPARPNARGPPFA